MGSSPIIRLYFSMVVSSIGRALLLHGRGYQFKSDTTKRFISLRRKVPISIIKIKIDFFSFIEIRFP
jgi:hypothetical protein